MALKRPDTMGIVVFSGPDASNTLDRHINDVRHQIAGRAFELCSERGWTPGQELEDWLRAESEILNATPVEIIDNTEEFTVRADVPGFNEKDIEIFAQPTRVLLRGNSESNNHQNQNGQVVYSERLSNQILRVIDLPAEINPEQCEAMLRDGVLELTLPKTGTGKTRARQRAA